MARYSHNISRVQQYQRRGMAVSKCRVFDKNGFVRWSIETVDGQIELDFGCFTSADDAIRDLRRALGAPATAQGEADARRASIDRHYPDRTY